MSTLEKIRAEIEKHTDGNNHCDEYLDGYNNGMKDALEIIDKYAEQETDIEYIGEFCHKHGLVLMSKEMADKYAEQEPCDDAISREAVVDDFIEWREKLEYAVGEDYSGVHLLNVAIQKIWDMPSVRPQEPCDDVVSREAVNDVIIWHETDGYISARKALDRIAQLPSVRPQEPKTGHWIKKEDDTCWWYVCSECEQEPLKNRWNDSDVLSTFCPYCGAKMVEPKESEDKE